MSQFNNASFVITDVTNVTNVTGELIPAANASQLRSFGLGMANLATSSMLGHSRSSVDMTNLVEPRGAGRDRRARPKSADCSGIRSFKGKSVVNINKDVTLEGHNVVLGAGNVRSKRDNLQHGETYPPYDNVDIELEVNVDGGATIKAKDALIVGAVTAEIVEKKSLLDCIRDDPDALNILAAFLGPERQNFKFNTNDDERAENTIRKTPMNIVKVMKSICMITWPISNEAAGIGTGFLATLPGYDGIALVSAGHNFDTNRGKGPFTRQFESCKFYFNALEGNVEAPGVVTFSPLDYNYTLVANLWNKGQENGIRVIMGKDKWKKQDTDDDEEILKYQDYSVILMDEAARDDLIQNKGLKVLQISDLDLDTHKNEPVCYVGHPYIKDKPQTSKAMRFSYGTCKIPEQDSCKYRIRYDLDTEGGASGSPVLGENYTVEAIHVTGYSNGINGGQIIRSVLKDLVQAKVGFDEN